ncbi:MAG: hypothetical protein KDA45_15505, partial [Planctomycetales bacterium]|nr:hypothetical protein [Planctomycetales bacterium]
RGGGFGGGDADQGSNSARRGGERGGGGARGGFNPAEMLKRFDRNGNNMIDPEEAQGPAQFFLQRMAQNNPKIDLKKPVPIDLLVGEIDRARGGRGGRGDSDEDSNSASQEPELLVPDFSLKTTPAPLEGFGSGSALFNVKVEERDLKEAEDRMRRYDSNKDGQLSPDELRRGRWSDDPMQYDRNRDGQLNKAEVALRYANRRVSTEEQRSSADNASASGRGGRGGDTGWGRGRGREENEEETKGAVNRFGDAKSYRSLLEPSGTKSQGLPDDFARWDANGDGQVLMNEFSSAWSQETLDEFLKWDLNHDGVITAQECLAAIAGGMRVGASTSSSGSATAAKPASASTSQGSAALGGSQLEWAKRQIEKYDKNNDGQLTANESEKMIIKPTGADENGDGVITIEEYAAFRARK